MGFGKENQVFLSIQVDSASRVSFLKKSVLRDLYLKIYPLDKATKDLNCGFTDNAINISGKSIFSISSNGWSHDNCHFFLTEGHDRNILGNDNLPEVGIKVSQNKIPHFRANKTCKSISFISTAEKDMDFYQYIPSEMKTKNIR